MFDHLFGHALCSHENTREVYLKHGICVLCSVVQRRRLLLDSRCRNQAVEFTLGLGDVANDLVESWHIADVDLSIMQCGTLSPIRFRPQVSIVKYLTKLFGSPLLHAIKVGRWFL